MLTGDKIKKNTIVALLAVLFLLAAMLVPFGVYAALPGQIGAQAGTGVPGQIDDANSAAFGVKAILPENQTGNASYFNLKMQPGQKQTISVEVYSLSAADHTIQLLLTNGQSNANGEIEYGVAEPVDASLEHPFTTLAQSGATEFLLPAGATITVDVDITMPNQPFEGVVLGGIRFLRKADMSNSGQAAQIYNDFAYLVGVVLFEDDAAVSSGFQLADISPEVMNYSPGFVISMRNTKANIEKNVNFTIDLFKDGQVYQTHEKQNASFAPNSRMDYWLPANEVEFEPGQYSAKIKLENESGQVWNFNHSFNINAKSAEVLQQEVVTMPNTEQAQAGAAATGQVSVWVYVAGTVLLLAAVQIIIFAAVKSRKKTRMRQQQIMNNIYRKRQRTGRA